MKLLRRSSRRHLLGHPWLSALCIVGIAAGVALVLAVDLAISSAERAFTLSTETIKGRATHWITGGTEGVPEETYRALRVDHGVTEIAPVIEADVEIARPAAGWVRLLGIDPYAELPFRSALRPGGDATRPNDLVTRPGTVLLHERRAARLGLAAGDEILVRARGVARVLTVAGTYSIDGEAASAPDDLVVVDVATAQEVLGQTGRLSRIDVILSDGAGAAARAETLDSLLPPGLDLVEATAAVEAGDLTRAFRLNLGFLSLLALVVGAFLIYNTMTFAVVRRRESFGRLRAIGVTRNEIVGTVLFEGAVFGAIGTALGVLAGIALGEGLLGIVSRTINDLYFVVSVNELALSPISLAKAFTLGLVATVAVTALPAREAARATPRRALSRSDLETRTAARAPRRAALGVVSLGLGAAVLALPWRGLLPCQAALFLFVVGFALTTPALTVLLARAMRPTLGRLFGPVGRIAARGIVTNLSRTAVAICALGVALSLTLGVRVMIESFRGSVVEWLGTTLQADVYVSTPRPIAGARGEAVLDPILVERLLAVPGIATATTNRTLDVTSDRGALRLVVLGLDAGRPRGFRFRDGEPPEVWRAFDDEEALLVSEPLAWRHGLSVGDRLTITTDGDDVSFPVAAVFHDYASEHGYAVLNRDAYERHWRDRRVTALGLFAEPGTDLVPALQAAAGTDHGLRIQSRGDLRKASIEVFDRTFAITAVLRALSGLVAFIGVLSALMSLQLERGREIGVLRAHGLTRGQVMGLGVVQSATIGLIAGILALPLGVLFSFVLTGPINQRSFGWTLPLEISAGALGESLALGVIAALAAGVLPALWMSRTSPARALRDE